MTIHLLLILIFIIDGSTSQPGTIEIKPVPKTVINLDTLEPSNFKPAALQLEIKGFKDREGRILSIGDVIRYDNFLFVSYPQYDLVARYTTDNRKTIFIGPQNSGGNTVPLKDPGHISHVNGHLSISSRTNGQVFITNMDGELVDYDMMKENQNPFPAPSFPVNSDDSKRRYLIIDHHNQHLIMRVNQSGKPIVRYGFGPDERTRKADPMDWSFRGTGMITETWDVVFISFSGARLLHFDSKAGVIERIILESKGFSDSPFIPLRPGYETTPLPLDPIKAVQYAKGTYWILLEINSRSHLLTVKGDNIKLLRLEKTWDGIHLSSPYLTLYHRHSGLIRSYRLK